MKIHSFKIFLIILEVSKNFLHIYSPWMRQRQIFFFEYFNPKYQPFNGHDKYARENV